jgi:formamidopyrimidine-DNA glycosylase
VPGQFHHVHPAPERHDHVVLDMDSGARVTLNDARRFGALDLVPTARPRRIRCWPALGPEPWATFHAAHLARDFAGARRRSRRC